MNHVFFSYYYHISKNIHTNETAGKRFGNFCATFSCFLSFINLTLACKNKCESSNGEYSIRRTMLNCGVSLNFLRNKFCFVVLCLFSHLLNFISSLSQITKKEYMQGYGWYFIEYFHHDNIITCCCENYVVIFNMTIIWGCKTIKFCVKVKENFANLIRIKLLC